MSTIILTGCAVFGLEAALASPQRRHRVCHHAQPGQRRTVACCTLNVNGLGLDQQWMLPQPHSFPLCSKGSWMKQVPIDVLVNNAGILTGGAFEDLSEAMLREAWNKPVPAPSADAFECCRTCASRIAVNHHGVSQTLSHCRSGPANVAFTLPLSTKISRWEGAPNRVTARRSESAGVSDWPCLMAGTYATGHLCKELPEKRALPDYYPDDSPYRPLVEYRLRECGSGCPPRRTLESSANCWLILQTRTVRNSAGRRVTWQKKSLVRCSARPIPSGMHSCVRFQAPNGGARTGKMTEPGQ